MLGKGKYWQEVRTMMQGYDNWCFIYRNIEVGGNETLICRIAEYLDMLGKSSYLVCETIVDQIKPLLIKSNTNIVFVDKWNSKNAISSIPIGVDLVITFRIQTYFIITQSGVPADTIMYCVHPSHLTFDNLDHTLKRKCFSLFFSNFIKDNIRNQSIIFMDCESASVVSEKYNCTIPTSSVFLLPYLIPQNRKKGFTRQTKTILTIARADFPFKGYVAGLIDAFMLIRQKNIDAKLVIISGGKDIKIIEEKIRNLDDVVLMPGKPYEELEREYLAADIFVGMGQTAIEAASYGVPTIIADANTMEFNSPGFFHESPRRCSGINSPIKGEELLLKLFSFDNKKLEQIQMETMDGFKSNYSMSEFVNRIEGRSWNGVESVKYKLLNACIKNRLCP